MAGKLRLKLTEFTDNDGNKYQSVVFNNIERVTLDLSDLITIYYGDGNYQRIYKHQFSIAEIF